MSKFTTLLSAAGAMAAGAILTLPASAAAQSAPTNAEVIVYGNDPCPRSTDDKIVVCTHRPEAERYRIPPKMRPSGTPQQTEAWAVRSKNLKDAGKTGIGSCSAVGPAGYTGCLVQQVQEAKGERKQTAEQETPPQ
jgi:hypothetical protein